MVVDVSEVEKVCLGRARCLQFFLLMEGKKKACGFKRIFVQVLL